MDAQALLIAQGVYFLATGVWPLVHLRSFMAVTGEKTDRWLVRMVGLLAASIGGALLLASQEAGPPGSVVLLAAAAAASFLIVDVVYVAKRVIGPIYLGDAVVEIGFLLAWAWWGLR